MREGEYSMICPVCGYEIGWERTGAPDDYEYIQCPNCGYEVGYL